MHILLTGATGFLGKRVLRSLLAAGLTVRCAVRSRAKAEALNAFVGNDHWRRVEITPVNLARVEDCRDVVDGCDVVLHAAAALQGCPSNLVHNTIIPTRSLMTAAADLGIQRFVLVSSLGVYGSQTLRRYAILDELCPVDAAPSRRDAYTYSKILQEEVAREISKNSGVPLVILRPGVIFGDERGLLSQRVGLQVGNWLLRMGGRQSLPLTYVENCAMAIAQAVTASDVDGQTINIVDDEQPTGIEVVRCYRQAGNRLHVIGVPRLLIPWLAWLNVKYSAWSENQIPEVLTPHRVHAVWKPLRYSNVKAKQLLGWTPEIDWETACQRSSTSTACPTPPVKSSRQEED